MRGCGACCRAFSGAAMPPMMASGTTCARSATNPRYVGMRQIAQLAQCSRPPKYRLPRQPAAIEKNAYRRVSSRPRIPVDLLHGVTVIHRQTASFIISVAPYAREHRMAPAASHAYSIPLRCNHGPPRAKGGGFTRIGEGARGLPLGIPYLPPKFVLNRRFGVKIGKLKKDPAPYSGIRTSATFLNASR